jgi:hypothetical protein
MSSLATELRVPQSGDRGETTGKLPGSAANPPRGHPWTQYHYYPRGHPWTQYHYYPRGHPWTPH